MAARRVAKSAVDWTAFAAKVPAEQREFYRAFKGKCDQFVSRVHSYPENMPKIDFEFYRTRLPAAMVDKFEKEFAAVNVPYPKDTAGLAKKIDTEEAAAKKETEAFITKLKERMTTAQENLALYDKIPGPDKMTFEMMFEYFPHLRIGHDKPSFWPHTKSTQPGSFEHFP